MQFRPPSHPGGGPLEPDPLNSRVRQPLFMQPGQYEQPHFYQTVTPPHPQPPVQQAPRSPRVPPRKGMRRNDKIALSVIASVVGIVFLVVFAIVVGAGASNGSSLSQADQDATATASSANVAATNAAFSATSVSASNAVTPTPVMQPALKATTAPKPTATAQPTHQVTPQPTPKPTQPPVCQAVNNNPWCYNFSPGNLITNPPSNFCSYFNCIASFWSGSGFVNECQDTTYSLSGGHQGDCSHHGGELRPLYSH